MSKSDFPSFVRRDVPLAMLTRLQLGGTAEYFAEPPDEEALSALLKQNAGKQIVRVLGAGSSVLPSGERVEGMVISLSAPAFCAIQVNGTQIVAGAGAKLNQVITQAVSQGLSGCEGFIGIPGTLGGAIHANIETNTGCIEERVESVSVMDLSGNSRVIAGSDLSFWFQTGQFDNAVILSATLSMKRDDPMELSRQMHKRWIVRKAHQPMGELPSAMLFRNPRAGHSAADLIVQAGLKGTKVGGAAICERNANFMAVEPEAVPDDVLRLMQYVQDEVRQCTETELEPAIEVW